MENKKLGKVEINPSALTVIANIAANTKASSSIDPIIIAIKKAPLRVRLIKLFMRKKIIMPRETCTARAGLFRKWF